MLKPYEEFFRSSVRYKKKRFFFSLSIYSSDLMWKIKINMSTDRFPFFPDNDTLINRKDIRQRSSIHKI